MRLTLLSLLFATSCNVNSINTNPHGVDVDAGDHCPRVLLVADGDYSSTNISVVGFDGSVLSSSLISSASSSVGISAPLSGDVVLPHDAPPSMVVLIDRYPNSVVTWVDLASGKVAGQLSVATGFPSNPHDYLQVSPTKAYVTRYETNSNPGRQMLDQGGDVIVVDSQAHSVTSRIDLSDQVTGPFLPRADRMTRIGTDAVVLLGRLDAGFASGADGRIVGINVATDAIDWALDLPGFANCGALARSPSLLRLAVGCSGVFAEGTTGQFARSGIVLLDIGQLPPRVIGSWHIANDLKGALAPTLAFFSETQVLGTTYGDLGLGHVDSVFTFDTNSGQTAILDSAASAFSFGEVWCYPTCTSTCFLADAGRKRLRTWSIEASGLRPALVIFPDVVPGLPPRGLGSL